MGEGSTYYRHDGARVAPVMTTDSSGWAAMYGMHRADLIDVLERTRESALLRALGLTRRGLRWMISMEAVLLGVMGAVAGVAFGVGFGWATGRAFLRTDGGPVSYPILEIVGYIALAGVAALLASVIPARRAARLTVIDGLAAELPTGIEPRRSQVKIVGQKGVRCHQGQKAGGIFPPFAHKTPPGIGARCDRGSTAAQYAVFDPRSPADTLWGYDSPGVG